MTDMNEDESKEDTQSESPKPAGGFGTKKIMLFIVIPLIILLLTGGGGLYMIGFFSPTSSEVEQEQEQGKDSHTKEKKDHSKKGSSHEKGNGAKDGEKGGASGIFLVIPSISVNLEANEDDQPRFLRLSVALELADESERAAVEAIMPRVVDEFQAYLRELRVEDLRGSAGLYRLQVELLWRVNQAAQPIHVKDVLFQEILIN